MRVSVFGIRFPHRDSGWKDSGNIRKRKHNKNNDKLIYPDPLQATSSKITESSWFRII